MARITRVMRALVRLVMAADASGEVRSTEPDLCVDGLRGGRVHMRGLRTSVAILTATITISLALTSAPASASGLSLVLRTLDGSQNNLTHPSWGQAGTQYLRVGHANYADGISAMVSGPSPRYVSNRVFNDRGQNIFSEGGVTNWGWVWGQFLDHDIGLRDETSTGSAALPFNAGDALESFRNDFGAISFSRTPAAPGTGVATPRQQINTISSYIDASNVYGTTKDRLLWLRAGPLAPGATHEDLAFGEDYELLASTPEPRDFAVVGVCESGVGVELRSGGRVRDLGAWEHFRTRACTSTREPRT